MASHEDFAVDPLVESVSAFAQDLAASGDESELLRDLVARLAEGLRLTGAGVMLGHEAGLRPATSSLPLLSDLMTAEGRLGEGPGVEAHGTGRPVLIDDVTARAGDLPGYSEAAREGGIASVAALPLLAGGRGLGVVELFASSPRRWTPSDARAAQVLTDLAAGHVALIRRLDEQRRLTGQLQQALDTRVLLEQAKGMVAVQRGVGVDDALEVLRRHANRHGATLQATADAVVRLGLRP